MSWSRKLRKTLDLRDARRVATLGDARALLLRLPELHRRNPHWEYAEELMEVAARARAKPGDVAAAERQIGAALRAEGLL